jgi:hypothetical protein
MEHNLSKKSYLFGSIILIWTVFVFFQYINNHTSYVRIFHIIDTAFIPLFYLAFLALLAFSLGRTILGIFPKMDMEQNLLFVFSSALGFIMISLVMILFTFCHLLSMTFVSGFLLLALLLSVRQMLHTLKHIRIPVPAFASLYEWIFFLLIALFIVMNLLYSLAPPGGLDEQQYHLSVPKSYIRHGGFVRTEYMGQQVKFPQNIEMIYTLAMMLQGDILAKLVNFYFGFLCLFLIRAFVKKFFTFGCLLPCAIFYCSWLVYFVSTQANVEMGLAFFEGVALLSLILWLESLRGREQSGSQNAFYFWFSALGSGFCLGIKYTFLFSLMGLFLIFLYYGVFVLRDWRKMLVRAIFYFLIVLVVFSPWMIKNTLIYKMPLAPYRVLYHLRFAAGLSGKKEASAPSEAVFQMRNRTALLFKGVYPRSSFADFILIPYNATIYGEWPMQVFDTLVAPFYLMFFPFVFFIRKKSPLVIALLIYIMSVYIQWHIIQPITRYLTSVLPLMSILIALVIHYMSQGPSRLNFHITHGLKIIIVVTLFITLVAQTASFIYLNPVYYLLKIETKSSYLARANPAHIQPVIDFANENLPAESRILLLWEKRGYYLEREYMEDASGNILARVMYQTKDPVSAAEELRKMGYTHILCDTNLPASWFGSGYKKEAENQAIKDLGNRELEFFNQMAEVRLTLLKRSGGIYLYQID